MQITEVGTMNVFIHWINEKGGSLNACIAVKNIIACIHSEPEIATPELDGTILSGITRMSALELTRKWVLFWVIFMVTFKYIECNRELIRSWRSSSQ